ncbi:MAG: Response regulator rcp1 [Phycisphaerae bacterium]|nr:Response regulator rcp1 [Phycisphaerae bacterium]
MIRTDLRVVSDGEEALDYLQRRGRFTDPVSAPAPDLVLLDLNLPRLDGRGVLERMRADEALRTVPVVVLTTSRQEEDILRSYRVGCNSYLSKPVRIEEFIDVVRQLKTYWLELVALPPAVDAAPQ